MDSGDDAYELLGVSENATASQIRAAYRKLALKHHPDKQTTQEAKIRANVTFAKISNAYELLGDDEKRQEYDQRRRSGGGREATFGSNGPGDDVYPEGGYSNRRRNGRARSENARSSASSHADVHQMFHDHFRFHDPFQVFRQAFGDEFTMGGSAFPTNSGGGRGGSMMGDNFFGGSLFGGIPGFGGGGADPFSMMQQQMSMMHNGMSGMSGMSTMTMSSSSTSSFGGSGMSTSTSTTTRIVNGKRETVTETITRKPDGTVERKVETIGDGMGNQSAFRSVPALNSSEQPPKNGNGSVNDLAQARGPESSDPYNSIASGRGALMSEYSGPGFGTDYISNGTGSTNVYSGVGESNYPSRPQQQAYNFDTPEAQNLVSLHRNQASTELHGTAPELYQQRQTSEGWQQGQPTHPPSFSTIPHAGQNRQRSDGSFNRQFFQSMSPKQKRTRRPDVINIE